jgi:hypothetical protein
MSSSNDLSKERTPTEKNWRRSPVMILVFTLLLVVLIEAGIMVVLGSIQSMSPMQELIVDSLSLGCLLSPALYFVLYKPLTDVISEKDEAIQKAIKKDLQMQNQIWLQSHVETFAMLIQKAHSTKNLVEALITNLTPLLGGAAGIIFVINERTQHYDIRGTYSCNKESVSNNSFEPGVGLVGQCVQENKIIITRNIPDDYIKISSGLGESSPHSIILIPIPYQEKVLAVIEVASFSMFSTVHEQLMQKLTPMISLGLTSQLQVHRKETDHSIV